MKKILVTGGAGFIGSNFVKHIYETEEDWKIIVLDALTYAGNLDNIPDHIKYDRFRFEFWHGNILNNNLVDNLVARADFVVHFAAESHVTKSIYDSKVFFETDVLGTLNIANAVLKNKENIERFIHISTSEVYGTAEFSPMTEEHPLNPRSPYASAKCGADRLVYSYITTYNLPAAIVRPFNNYGPNQHLEKLIPRFITNALLEQPLTIHGDGSAARDWVYVEDTCKAVKLILKADITDVAGEVFNIATARNLDIKTIAHLVLKEMDLPRDKVVKVDNRLGQVQNHCGSGQKLKNVIGFVPEVDFEEGLSRTIEWYSKNQEWWRKIQWMMETQIFDENGHIYVR